MCILNLEQTCGFNQHIDIIYLKLAYSFIPTNHFTHYYAVTIFTSCPPSGRLGDSNRFHSSRRNLNNMTRGRATTPRGNLSPNIPPVWQPLTLLPRSRSTLPARTVAMGLLAKPQSPAPSICTADPGTISKLLSHTVL